MYSIGIGIQYDFIKLHTQEKEEAKEKRTSKHKTVICALHSIIVIELVVIVQAVSIMQQLKGKSTYGTLDEVAKW